MTRPGSPLLIAWAVLLALPASRAGAGPVVIDAARHHLGTAGVPEWREFAADPPEGPGLTVRFRAKPNDREATLLVRQRDVKLDRPVALNGRSLGRLFLMESDLVHALAVPADALRDGENVLTIGPAAGGPDDVVIHGIALDPRPRREALRGAALDVRVTEAGSGRPLPCRVTVVDDRGALAPLDADPAPGLAVRPGVAYTADGRVRLGLPPGRYTVYATRGFEYGLASRAVELADGGRAEVALEVAREVPTPGLAACDTHIHTFTHSGHGDATLDERIVTLAGEGVELPVATDHNHLTDFRPPARRLGLLGALTPVVGDEVTTRRGHFNAFPFDPGAGASAPDPGPAYWPDLFRSVRAGDPARVIVLNHPRDTHAGFRPFGPEHYNSAIGEGRDGPAHGFDAVELINSGAAQTDPMRVVRDWFALWNHGHEVTGVGASDSHDVSRYIVGQGRTYVACRDDDPGRLDVSAACASLRAGRAAVSLGLLARLTVGGRFGPGDLAAVPGDTVDVAVTVLGPSWVRANRVELFANGVRVKGEAIADGRGAGVKARVAWSLPKPRHDIALVAVASGPGVTAPYWALAKPYQPASIDWEPRVLSVTNPVKVDADGSGAWDSPRSYAQAAIEIFGTEPSRLFPSLAGMDEAIATQAAAFCLPAGQARWPDETARALEAAPGHVRRGFDAALSASRRP